MGSRDRGLEKYRQWPSQRQLYRWTARWPRVMTLLWSRRNTSEDGRPPVGASCRIRRTHNGSVLENTESKALWGDLAMWL
jgi:hypothetical protein